jgi:hypothetical protein
MASVEISALSNHLEEDEISALSKGLDEHGIPDLEGVEDAEALLLDSGLDDDILADFLDQLDASEAACDVYLPVEFEEVVEAGGYRFGSSHALLLALESLKDELAIDEDEEEGAAAAGGGDDEFEDLDDESGSYAADDEPSAIELKDEQLRSLWKLFHKGARVSISRNLCLFVHRD